MLGESSNRGQLRNEEEDYQNIRLFHPLPLNINTAERKRCKRGGYIEHTLAYKIMTCSSFVFSQIGNACVYRWAGGSWGINYRTKLICILYLLLGISGNFNIVSVCSYVTVGGNYI